MEGILKAIILPAHAAETGANGRNAQSPHNCVLKVSSLGHGKPRVAALGFRPFACRGSHLRYPAAKPNVSAKPGVSNPIQSDDF